MPKTRPLRDEERALIHWMIEHGDAEPAKYLAQLEDARVVSECSCGCTSIDFQVGSITADFKSGIQVIADFAYGPEEAPFGAFIFTCNDILGGLEVYSYTSTPAPLPALEDLRVIAKSQKKSP